MNVMEKVKNYDIAIKMAIESFVEENYEEGVIECVADVIEVIQVNKVVANAIFDRAFEYLTMMLIDKDDFIQWFEDTVM